MNYSETYLPRPDGMSREEYSHYVKRAEFCPFVTRTAEGSHGLIFRKQPNVTNPDDMKFYLENVDGKGSSLYKFLNDVTWDVMITGWGGCLVDVPFNSEISQRDSENYGIYPYVVYYIAEEIINYQTKIIGRREVVNLIVLKESVMTNKGDRFSQNKENRYRVLELDENGYYKQSLYDDSEQLIFEVYPTKNGKKLKEIPFFFFTNVNPQTPMFMPVIEVNEAWFRKSADLENGLHWTGIPTPYCTGYTPEIKYDDNGREIASEPLKLGGSQIIYFPEGTAVNYLEFSGTGLSQLQQAMEKDEERMAILGARIISQERRGVEAVETAKIHRAGENSVIATFANEMSDIFTKVFKLYLEWATSKELDSEVFYIRLNTDYDVSSMNSSDLQALVSAWQSGAISNEVLFYNMKNGELVPNEMSFDDMQEAIQEEKEKIVENQIVDDEEETE